MTLIVILQYKISKMKRFAYILSFTICLTAQAQKLWTARKCPHANAIDRVGNVYQHHLIAVKECRICYLCNLVFYSLMVYLSRNPDIASIFKQCVLTRYCTGMLFGIQHLIKDTLVLKITNWLAISLTPQKVSIPYIL